MLRILFRSYFYISHQKEEEGVVQVVTVFYSAVVILICIGIPAKERWEGYNNSV